MTDKDKIEITRLVLGGFRETAVAEGLPIENIVRRTADSESDVLSGDLTVMLAKALIAWATENNSTIDETIVTMTNELNDKEYAIKEKTMEDKTIAELIKLTGMTRVFLAKKFGVTHVVMKDYSLNRTKTPPEVRERLVNIVNAIKDL